MMKKILAVLLFSMISTSAFSQVPTRNFKGKVNANHEWVDYDIHIEPSYLANQSNSNYIYTISGSIDHCDIKTHLSTVSISNTKQFCTNHNVNFYVYGNIIRESVSSNKNKNSILLILFVEGQRNGSVWKVAQYISQI